MALPIQPAPAPGSPEWWLLRSEDTKQRRPRVDGITLERITAVALVILEREGLDALTMRAVAEELATGAASLYRHVASRDELLVELVDHVIGSFVSRPPPSLGWRGSTEWSARRFRKHLLAHPAVVPLLTSAQVLGPNSMRGREASLRLLIDAGLPPKQAVRAYLALFHFIVAEVQQDVRHRARTTEQRQALRALFARQDGELYPTVVASAGALANHNAEEEFEFGLQALLDGIATMMTG